MLRWSPLERHHPEVVCPPAVGHGGLEDVVTVEVLRLGEVGGVRQVGDVPATKVTLPRTLRSDKEPLEGCPASDGDSEILTSHYNDLHNLHLLTSDRSPGSSPPGPSRPLPVARLQYNIQYLSDH